MPYKLYIGDTSFDTITFDDFKEIIGDAHAGRVSLIGGKAEIREALEPSGFSTQHQQKWNEFMTEAVRFYVVQFQTLEQKLDTKIKLDESEFPFIFFGTHGAGDTPDDD